MTCRRIVSLGVVFCGVAFALSTLPSVAHAGPGKGKGQAGHKTVQKAEQQRSLEVDVNIRLGQATFSDKERRIVRDYFHRAGGSLPPGLARKQSLPPGLQKHMQRNGRLPHGLEKRGLPSDLVHQLPAYHGPYERSIIGNDLIMLDPKTGLILDVMQEVFDIPIDEGLQKVGARRVSY